MRRQPPIVSPLAFKELLAAAMPYGGDSRSALSARLARRYRAADQDVFLTGSGTQALQIALGLASPLNGPLRVGLPAYSCWDVGTAAQGAGAEVLFYDLDPNGLTPDLDSLRAALARGVSAVVVAPLFGYPVDWSAIRELAARHGCLVVEDAAQGLGSSWEGEPAGALGDLSVLSFGRGKGWTGGGGGALLIRKSLPARPSIPGGPPEPHFIPWLTRCGAQSLFGRPWLYFIPTAAPGVELGTTVYREPVAPRTMSPWAARLALLTEEASRREAEHRRRTGHDLLGRLRDGPRIRPVRPSGSGDPGYLRLPIRVAAPVGPRWAREASRLGIVRGYPKPLHTVPQLTDLRFGVNGQRYPGAEMLAEELFTVPTHSLLSSRDLSRIVTYLDSI